MLIFPRSLALAGESLTRAISESLDYTIDQAERLKIESGQSAHGALERLWQPAVRH